MNYLLLIISVACGVAKNLISKSGNDKFSWPDGMLFSNIITALLAIVIFMSGKTNFSSMMSPGIIVQAFVLGACTMLSQMLHIIAVKNGSVSVCSLIYSCGFVIPTIFGIAAFGDYVSVTAIIGIIMLMAGIYAVSMPDSCGSNGKKWLIPAFLAMLSSGMVGIIQKLYRHIYPECGLNEFLVLSFGFMLVMSLVLKLALRKPCEKEKVEKNGKYWMSMMILAVSVVAANKLNLYLSGVMSSSIFYPCVNGGCIVATALSSRVLFREKLTLLQWVGIVGSVIAIILIVLHF